MPPSRPQRPPRGVITQRPKSAGKTMKRLLSYLTGPYKLRLLIVFISIIVSAVIGVFGALFVRRVIDDYVTLMLVTGEDLFGELVKAILQMAAIYLVAVAANYAYNRLMVGISQGILKDIRDEMFSHMQTLPIKYFDTHTHGDVMSHYTNDADTLRQMLSQSIPQVLSSAVSIASVFFAMLSISVWLTVLVILGVVLSLTSAKKIGGRSSKYFSKQQKSLGDVNGYIEEMINGQKVVKVFNFENRAKETFDGKNEELRENASLANTFANILMPIMGNLGHLQYALIAIIGGALAIAAVPNLYLAGIGTLTLGSIASFMMLTRSFNMPMNQISQQFNYIIMALAGAERIFKLMDEEPEVDDGYVTLVNVKYDGDDLVETEERTNIWAWKHPHNDGSLTYTKVDGYVTFTDVDFGYEDEKLVLHNVSLFAKPGQKIAFVGATGAGKTTITNLINRFYDIDDGKIKYDGINIKKIKKPDLRRSLGIVLQDVHLFSGSIMDNIRYGRLDASDEECIAAANLANAHDFIMRLPEGYDTLIDGSGGSLSQGQRQLLSIARAAVADPPVMILDEATSSIDTRTESIVQSGMDALMYGRTVFVIAHRLSTVQNSEAIIVLDQGKIIERGDHESLVAQGGKYYQLYTGAFELE